MLLELDFVVEHRARSKIGHVDALSRHVGAITNPDPLRREKFKGNKKRTRFAEGKKQVTTAVEANFFLTKMT
jgi:hypothetical protein